MTDTQPLAPTDDEIVALADATRTAEGGANGMTPRNELDAELAMMKEVRKQDEALIRQLVERLERADKISGYPNNREAIKAGRARLEGNT